jgi:hypothetical protein
VALSCHQLAVQGALQRLCGLGLGEHQRRFRLLPRHRALEQQRLVARRAKRTQHFLQLPKRKQDNDE